MAKRVKEDSSKSFKEKPDVKLEVSEEQPKIIEDVITPDETSVEKVVITEIKADKEFEVASSKKKDNTGLNKTVEVTTDKSKVRFKFSENFTYNVGIQKIVAKKGDILMVEKHIANKLVTRKLGYVL
jgi:hypothetical protein